MADIKISALSALTGANSADNDVYVIVDTDAVETKKQTRSELFQDVPAATFKGANVFNEAGADVDQRMEGDTDANLFYLDAGNDRIGIGTATPSAKLQVFGSIAFKPPVTVTTDFTVGAGDFWTISNRGATNTATLPAASTNSGRVIGFTTIQAFALNSAISNVVPRIGGSAGTAILPATDGAWAVLQSDGTNWIILASGT